MLELYHGSNVAIDKIDLSKGHINKDFGKGFYLTSLISLAQNGLWQSLHGYEQGTNIHNGLPLR